MISKETAALWGKKQIDENGQVKWLPLIAHMIDTKNVINWLYLHFLNEGQRQIINADLTQDEAIKLVKFLGFEHDLGKACPAFQTKASYSHNSDLDSSIIEHLIRSGFTGLDTLHLDNAKRSPHARAGEAILEDRGLNGHVGAIIGGHHGLPQINKPIDQILDHTDNYYQIDKEDPNSRIYQRWHHAQDELINYGLKLCGYKSLEEIPRVKQPQAVILEGLLIVADWLASSEHLTNDDSVDLFPLIPLNKGFGDLDMDQRFKNGIMNWKVNGEWIPEEVTDIDQEYQKRFGFQPREVQKEISQMVQNTATPGMMIVEAPTGLGKTEIALVAAEQMAMKTYRNGLFFGLPTQATANAMFARVEDWINKIAKEEDDRFTVRLMHSKAQFNKNYRDLPRAENINDDNDKEASGAVVNSWFSGKKSILNEFTIGTIDHLLLMGLKQKHLFLRHLGLSGKIVIIDEIHAYDAYMNSYLYTVLRWLGAYHVPVIALSATLPAEKRAELITAYLGKKDSRQVNGPKNWETTQEYPLLSITDGDQLKQYSNFKVTQKREVKIKRLHVSDDELINKILNEIKNGGVAGVIVNTVKRAQKLAKLLPTDLPNLVLHSSFLAPDRARIETDLQNKIGKNGKRPEKLVVIGTQVLEQSLDIDFDVLFTDIAPIDLLIQRIGRLQRHSLPRPEELKEATAYVMGINAFGDYGDANEAVYDKYLLMKTDQFLPNQLSIPQDVSHLVQLVYDPETDTESVNSAEKMFTNKIKDEHKKAEFYQIKAPEKRRDLHGWLSVYKDTNSDVKAEAAVRDIDESIEIVMLKQTQTGYSLLNGKPLELADDQEIASQLIRLPRIKWNLDRAIKDLENITQSNYPNWRDSPWLHGSLALTLDQDNTVEFEGYNLKYSSKLGLEYEKEGNDER